MRVTVVGGGLAGLAAALELVDSGHDVTVLEARPTLGGAVQTLPEREGDPPPPPDNGQHIALGCFTEYLRFLDRIGEGGSYRRQRLSLPVIGEDATNAAISRSPLSILRYRHLPRRERLGVVRTLVALRRAQGDDDERFGALLRRLGASDAQIDRFWDVFVRPALNLRADEASAAMGVFTVRTALLGKAAAADVILPTRRSGPCTAPRRDERSSRRGRPSGRASASRAWTSSMPTRSSSRCRRPSRRGSSASPSRRSSRRRSSPCTCSSTAAHALAARGAPRLAGALGVRPRCADRTRARAGPVPDGRRERSPRAARHPRQGNRRPDGRRTHRPSRRAELLWSRVSREPYATVALRPGTAAERRGTATDRPNVVRAGAWTDTGWPATMEGAVRSGRAAARTILEMRAVSP